ncbi:MAG TPA: four helix bundle protein [Chitinispirillaceae bacterium]|nr:four helix bundle protein [Chitinispirillaceae bacterium]
MKKRTKGLASAGIKLISDIPNTIAGNIIAKQLVRCATSVGANYRAVCRARSKADFIAKLNIVLEEADETAYWLEIAAESEMMSPEKINPLLNETNEIISILVASIKTSKNKMEEKSKSVFDQVT